MFKILLTKYDGKILGPIAILLGILMNTIFNVLDKIGIPNIGLTIIIFTLVIYLLLTPLTYKQQKFSKLSQKMNPELKAIQKKYEGRKDNESMMAMNEETRAVYAKYGVSPTGSCVQLLIQMPILFALYRVIYAIPAYVTKVGDTFRVLADKIVEVDSTADFLQNSNIDSIDKVVKMYGKSLTKGTELVDVKNGIVDILNKVSSSDLIKIADHYNLNDIKFEGHNILSTIGSNGEVISRGLIDKYNYFLGINISETPSGLLNSGIHGVNGFNILLVIGALMIPFLAALTQWINTKLIPQPENSNGEQNTMAASMKSMNTMMPIMSAVFCFTLPAGMGLYWIAGAVIRSVQQVVINKIIDNENIDEVIAKNIEKAKAKAEKEGAVSATSLNKNASINTKKLNDALEKSIAERDAKIKEAKDLYSKKQSPTSLAAKANLVRDFNEKNNK